MGHLRSMTNNRSSVDDIVKSTVSLVLLNWRTFVARLWFTATLMLIIDFCGAYTLVGWLFWVLTLLSLLVNVVFAVITHRLFLLGEEEASSKALMPWGKRETYFLFCLLALMVGAVLIFGVMGIATMALSASYASIVGVPIVLYLFARVSLVFPAAAVDEGLTFTDSWRITENHQILVLAIVIGIPVLIGIVWVLLSYIPYSLVLNLLLDLVLGVVGIGCLSLTYKELRAARHEN